MPDLIWQTLRHRGFTTVEEIKNLIAPQLKDLRDPFCLDGMREAVERLCRAFSEREIVGIYGDFDLDGTSGLALLKKGFELLGFERLCHYQPKRLSEGYGFHEHALKEMHQLGARVVVTVDVGITAIKTVEKAKELAVDVIITDHHLPKETLPQALAVVNPNKGTCGSSLGHLSGAGVAFYLLLALKSEFEKRGWNHQLINAKCLLDCFVIGTLTDMVPLVKENRVLVKHGLVELARTQRPGLRALLEALNLWGRPLSSQDVAIRFAPKLNALSRMELGLAPLDLFLVETDEEAEKLVSQVMNNNEIRLARQALAEERALQQFLNSGQKHFIWVYSPEFHQGVVGLVATKLSQKFNLPAFVGAQNEQGTIVGSGRAPAGARLNLLEALEYGSSHLLRFGGHAPAAGFELSVAQAQGFEESLREYFETNSPMQNSLVASLPADGRDDGSQIDEEFMRWYESLGPFGVQFEVPNYWIHSLKIVEVKKLKGGHLRFALSTRTGRKLSAIWFSPPVDHPLAEETSLPFNQSVELLVEPQWNFYNGRRSIQLLVKDARL